MEKPLIYRAIFGSSELSVSSWKDSEISAASLENLRPLIPQDVDLKRNVDLMSVAFNGATPNLVNKNDDVIDSATAVKILDLAKNKPINIEHQSKKIVGHILNVGFSKFGSSEMMTREEALETKDVFNMSFGGVIYSKIHPELANLLEQSQDEKSKLYHSASTSWEIMFDKYELVVGSKNLKDAELISDPKKISELKKHLRKYGGSGFLDAKKTVPVYRKVVGDNVLPVGWAVVLNPAAQVKGMLVESGKEKKSTAKIFLPAKSVITSNSKKIMDLETLLEQMNASIQKLVEGKEAEEAKASLAKDLAPKLKELSAEWSANRDKALKDKDAAEAKMSELYAQVEKMGKQLNEAQTKLWEMEENSRATKTLVRYSERMAAMEDEFEMDDDDKCVIASKLKTLEVKDDESGNDSAFASFKEEISKLWKHKNKDAIAKAKQEFDAKLNTELEKKMAEISKASEVKAGDEGKTVEDALDKAKASEEKSVSNNNETSSTAGESFLDRFKKSFSKDSIKIEIK